MKNFKNYLLVLILFVCSSIIIISCSQDSTDLPKEFTYTSGKLSLNEYLNSSKSSSRLMLKGSGNEDIMVEAIFVSNIEIPENLNDEELNLFFDENSEIINGKLSYIIDDEIIYNSEFNNGIETVSSDTYNTQTEGDCSYEGVRQCTIKKIDDLSDWQKVVCAFRRGCVLQKIAACIIENC